jgi:hypothetical protein
MPPAPGQLLTACTTPYETCVARIWGRQRSGLPGRPIGRRASRLRARKPVLVRPKPLWRETISPSKRAREVRRARVTHRGPETPRATPCKSVLRLPPKVSIPSGDHLKLMVVYFPFRRLVDPFTLFEHELSWIVVKPLCKGRRNDRADYEVNLRREGTVTTSGIERQLQESRRQVFPSLRWTSCMRYRGARKP